MPRTEEQDHRVFDSRVLARYTFERVLGHGAYGVVWKCVDQQSGETVALKKIFDAFQNRTDAQRTYREVILLQELSGVCNIVQLQDVLGAENDKDLYLVFDYMESDLHRFICRGVLTEVQHQCVMHQLLKCLKFIHSAGLVHRDLKPSNILISPRCDIKVADFGLARSVGTNVAADDGNNQGGTLTNYVATRWYRAPEILLGSKLYTCGVDMWSLGCIFGEMLKGSPLFPGSSTLDQLDRIMEVTSKPTLEDIQAMQSPFAAAMLQTLPLTTARPLHKLFPLAGLESLHLLRGLLQLNAIKRLSAEDALQHPFVSLFHDPATELTSDHLIIPPVDDDIKLSVDEYRCCLYGKTDFASPQQEKSFDSCVTPNSAATA